MRVKVMKTDSGIPGDIPLNAAYNLFDTVSGIEIYFNKDNKPCIALRDDDGAVFYNHPLNGNVYVYDDEGTLIDGFVLNPEKSNDYFQSLGLARSLIDHMGLLLTDYHHTWSKKLREGYEGTIDFLNDLIGDNRVEFFEPPKSEMEKAQDALKAAPKVRVEPIPVRPADFDGVMVHGSFWKTEGGAEYVMGRIYHDAKCRFPDGTDIHTSRIISRTQRSDGAWDVKTRNSRYLVYLQTAKSDLGVVSTTLFNHFKSMGLRPELAEKAAKMWTFNEQAEFDNLVESRGIGPETAYSIVNKGR